MKKLTICTINMSQAQQNFLKDSLKEEINALQENIEYNKGISKGIWELCNPEDTSTTRYFKDLNAVKNCIRYMNKRLKKLQAIQKEVKSCFVETFVIEEDNV